MSYDECTNHDGRTPRSYRWFRFNGRTETDHNELREDATLPVDPRISNRSPQSFLIVRVALPRIRNRLVTCNVYSEKTIHNRVIHNITEITKEGTQCAARAARDATSGGCHWCEKWLGSQRRRGLARSRVAHERPG